MTLHVTPLPDSTDQRYGWQVTRNGRRLSSHYKKSGARRAADRKARSGEEIVIHRTDGTIQASVTA